MPSYDSYVGCTSSHHIIFYVTKPEQQLPHNQTKLIAMNSIPCKSSNNTQNNKPTFSKLVSDPHTITTVSKSNMSVKKHSTKKDEVPVFLQKTYHMINECDPRIATWSNDGRTFLIKEPDIFAVEIIPQYFKHNNLSSFVRQLNFYGFRKIKNDVIRLDDVNETTASKYLRFRHEKFLRGRPDLLIEIRKANQTNAADQQEVDDLKQEVAQLKSQFARLSSIVQQLTDGSTLNSSKPASKKRKLEADVVSSHPIAPSPVEDMDDMPYPVVPLLDPMVSDADLLVEDFPTGYTNSFPPPLTKYNHSRAPSCDLVESMFDFVNDGQPEHVPSQTVAPSPVNSAPPAVHSDAENMFGNPAPEPSQMDQTPSQKLNDALSALPHNLQETFVERIVESLTNPEAFSKHVEAVSVLATAAAIEAENQTLISNGEHGAPANTNNDPVQKEEPDKLSMKNQSEMTLPVAAAALGAFLAKYGNAKENKDVSNCTPQQ